MSSALAGSVGESLRTRVPRAARPARLLSQPSGRGPSTVDAEGSQDPADASPTPRTARKVVTTLRLPPQV